MYARDIYGNFGSTPQPNASPVPTHAPGEPEPMARTLPHVAAGLGSPAMFLVGMLGLAILLVTVSVRGGLDLELSA